jgi:hypothetical protein
MKKKPSNEFGMSSKTHGVESEELSSSEEDVSVHYKLKKPLNCYVSSSFFFLFIKSVFYMLGFLFDWSRRVK